MVATAGEVKKSGGIPGVRQLTEPVERSVGSPQEDSSPRNLGPYLETGSLQM